MAAVLTPVKQQRSSTTATARKATTPTGVTPEKQQQQHATTHTHKHSRSAASLGSALSISSRKRSRGASGTVGETTPDGAIAAGRPLDLENGGGGGSGKPPAALLDENSDLLRNGRALFAATTTSLGAPLDIPNKRRRTEAAAAAPTGTGTVNNNNNAGTAADILATPQRATTSKSAAPVASKRLSSSKKRSKRGIAEVTGAATGSRGSAAANKLAFLTEKGNATASASKRRAKEEEANTVYVAKYRADFPSYVFYFDGLDQTKRREGERAVRELGARTDPFFSKSVTHVVTSRAVPAMPASTAATATTLGSGAKGASKSGSTIFLAPSAAKENAVPAGLDKTAGKRGSSISPTKQSQGLSSKQHDSLIGLARRPKTRTAVAAANNAVLPMRTPPKIKPYVDTATDSQDILVKALNFGMKVWTVDKLQRMLARLLSPQSPSKAFLYTTQHQQQQAALHGGAYAPFTFQPPTRQSLPSLLRAEQLTGSTYERDMTTLRPDHHYFSAKTGYLLVEDTSGEYQPAHIKEYEQRVVPLLSEGEDRDTEWPTLWGGQEGRGAFTKPSANYVPTLPVIFAEEPKLTARANNFFAAVSNGNPSLKRSASMNALRNRHAANGSASASLQPSLNLDSYQAASGNSQAITSNIGTGTSTTTTRSGQIIGGALGAGSNPNSLANGIIVDKRLARLGSKARTHLVTLGKASNASATTTTTASTTAGVTAVAGAGAGADKENLPLKGSAALTRGQSVNGLMKRSLSLDTGLNTFRHLQPPKDEPKKPGYCENCRVRYEDFKTHTRSKKHRRFALDPANWEELDCLLASIGRPVNPELVELYEAAGCDVPSDVEKSDSEDEDDFSSNNGGEESEMDEDEEDDSGYASRSDNEEVQAAVAELRAKKARRDVPIEAAKPDAALDEEDLGDEDTNDEAEGEEDDEEVEKHTDSGDASTSEEEDILMSESGSDGANSGSDSGSDSGSEGLECEETALALAAIPRITRLSKDPK